MKLAVSNIAWTLEQDEDVYKLLNEYGYEGVEIAPTRVFQELPYDRVLEAGEWSKKIKREWGLNIPSMQSIWFGRQERIFGSDEERRFLVDYTKKAIVFAETINCNNLVLGCPKNRNIFNKNDYDIGIKFFKELGDYASEHNTIIGMEANPTLYNTNYINDTGAALELIKEVDSKGFLLNLDLGTMIYNNESVSQLIGNVKLINHVHISEPSLKPIEEREIHKDIKKILQDEGYNGYISIEMGKVDKIELLEDKMQYIRRIFG